jgi:DNA ligase (NAD+)
LINFNHSFEELEAINEIGPELAKNIVEYFGNDAHKRILNELVLILNIKYFEKKTSNSTSIFAGKKVCITGSFSLNGEKISRDELVKRLEELGGEFVNNVSKNTDFLLA